MDRVSLLNRLLAGRTLATAYLEIGCHRNETFNQIKADIKVGVDPKSGGTVRATSDEFFANNEQCFDAIFIDGLHHCEQVLRDVDNALRVLNPGGAIVLHDCLPTRREHQVRAPITPAWTGDVWRAMLALRQRFDIDPAVVDADWGLGVVLPRANSEPLPPVRYCDWEDSRKHLRVISPDDLDVFLNQSGRFEMDESTDDWFAQILISRFNIGAIDDNWLKHRFAHFERFTLPSVREQTESRFRWVLQADGGTPTIWKKRLESLLNDDARFSIVWSERSGEQTLALLPETKRHVIRLCGLQTHLATTRCDSDDALGRQFMQRIREAILPVLQPEFLDFTLGRQWKCGKTRLFRQPRNAFQTLVEPLNRERKPQMEYCINHAKTCERYPVRELEADYPMWLQVCRE